MSRTGSITLFSGGAAVRPAVGLSVTAAAVAAVESLGRSLALELGPIRVNVVRPGAVDTPLRRNAIPNADEFLAKIGASQPIGRVGTPGDIAEAVLFLMACSYTTGAVLHVDGGGSLTGR